jgi:hypothetical protein
MLSFIEHTDYIAYMRQTTEHHSVTMIDCNAAFNIKYMNVKKLPCTDQRIVFILTKTFDIKNTSYIKSFIKNLTLKLLTQYGEVLYGCVLLHKDGYYRFPYDGFKKVCDELFIKSIDTFITAPKSLHYDKYMRGCFNYSVKYFYECQDTTTMTQIDIVNHNKKLRTYSNDVIDNLIHELNTTLKRHLILLIGPPNIGKTTFAERLHGKKMRYIRTVVCNRKVRENVAIYLDEKDEMDDENLIIDGEHANEVERNMFIKACKVQNMHCISLLFDATKEECIYMRDSLFNETKGSIKNRSLNGITKFYNRYRVPRLSEGIKNIIKITGIPQVKMF